MELVLKVCCLSVVVVLCSAEMRTQFNAQQNSVKNQFIVRLASSRHYVAQAFVAKINKSPLLSIAKSTRVGLDVAYLLDATPGTPMVDVKRHIEEEFGEIVTFACNNFVVEAYAEGARTIDCRSQPGESPCRTHGGVDAWGLSRISQIDKLSGSSDFLYKWSDSNDGSGVTIYILDSGVYDAHNEFDDTNVRWGFTATAIAEREADVDLNGHGTHVAGIAAGKNYGVAKNADIVAVKVLDAEGRGSAYDVLEGLSFVVDDVLRLLDEHGTRPKVVVNLSLGISVVLSIIDDAIRHGTEMGIVYVVAAGNDAIDACYTSPASSPDVITVAAVNQQDAMSSFSNYGRCVDILAPGSAIKSAGIDNPGHTEIYQGTSMACPFVAGVVARYLSHKENSTNTICVKEHLFATAIHNRAVLWDTLTPNRMLYGGCNTCFGDYHCEAMFGEDVDTPWSLPPLPDYPENSATQFDLFDHFKSACVLCLAIAIII